MRFGIDCDGVLANFNRSYAHVLYHVTDKWLFPWTPTQEPGDEHITVWDWDLHYGYSKIEVSTTWNYINDRPDFWSTLDELPDCKVLRDLMPELAINHEVYFITARPGPTTKWQTEDWLIRHLDVCFTPTVLITKEKGPVARALELDVFVDDKLQNVQDVRYWNGDDTHAYLLDRAYNQTPYDTATRVNSLTDVFRLEGLP